MKSAPEPISWLLLERYALGELSADERADVEARLAASETDRACLAEILADQSELPPLVRATETPSVSPRARISSVHPGTRGTSLSGRPSSSSSRADSRASTRARAGWRRSQWFPLSATLSIAAAALLIVFLRERSGQLGLPAQLTDSGVKGADVALRLISERQGHDPTTYRPGERFKVEVSCPPKLSASLRLFVLQGEEVFEPLPRAPSFSCGNLVPWPGAFALDGREPADVCLYWGLAKRPTAHDFKREASCHRLAPP